ncbi:hypothetical protein DCAR_0934347 [Daucus carota subsp. sativus]|uniref:Uncharacterized protein n=1 Tax=Daucus carota subsp. sativus TaxID=79200 RepID=A0A175YF19_DAUCS|nr:hypothetical protein DCAR_0934347 [Daucus carota subsp. sativus]
MTIVGATEIANKDIEIDANTSAKDVGAVKKASSTRRKKVRSMVEILHVNDEEKSGQLASHNTTPKNGSSLQRRCHYNNCTNT